MFQHCRIVEGGQRALLPAVYVPPLVAFATMSCALWGCTQGSVVGGQMRESATCPCSDAHPPSLLRYHIFRVSNVAMGS